MPHVRIHGSTQCAVEKAPHWEATPYMLFFFFFFFKKYELIYEFGSEKYAETGNLDLENLIKAKMDNFDEGIWCYLSVQQAVTRMVGDRGERQLRVVTGCSH